MKKIAAVILSLVLLMTASTALAAVNASYSYASISENSTGAWGDDVEFSGRTPITGKNYSNATNNLYVAAQKEGDKNFGGTISTHLVAPTAVNLRQNRFSSDMKSFVPRRIM